MIFEEQLFVVWEKENVVIYEALCFDVAKSRINGAPNETQIHSCRFASLACKPLHYQRCPEWEYEWVGGELLEHIKTNKEALVV